MAEFKFVVHERFMVRLRECAKNDKHVERTIWNCLYSIQTHFVQTGMPPHAREVKPGRFVYRFTIPSSRTNWYGWFWQILSAGQPNSDAELHYIFFGYDAEKKIVKFADVGRYTDWRIGLLNKKNRF